MIKIIICDEHTLVRACVKSLLGSDSRFEVVGETGDGIAAIQLVRNKEPDIVLTELSLARLGRLELMQRFTEPRKAKFIVLTAQSEVPHVLEALQAGAMGYLLKDDSPEELNRAIYEVHGGNHFVSARLKRNSVRAAAVGRSNRNGDAYSSLTTREREILERAATGSTNGEIGRRLSISPRTVESHRASLMEKIGLRNQTELVRFAVRREIINP
jgi:two-component system, NarL family, response regulator NreC